MISAFEFIGEHLAPFLPFINGQNAAHAITIGVGMSITGLVLLSITLWVRLRRKGRTA